MSIARAYTLSNGIRMPYVGLGTYRVRDQATLDTCLLEALRAGYRLIDTAAVYRNEAAIGSSLKRILEQNLVPGLTREDIFLTSKLAVQDSLKNLGVDYIDLYLIHWPGWRALEDLYHARKLRAIGVSNYTLAHLSQLVERPHHSRSPAQTSSLPHPGSPLPTGAGTHGSRTMVIPHVHQFELHPRLFQRDMVDYCQHHRIQVQAYSSLGEGRLISLTPPPPPEMDAHYNAAPMPGALDIMPDLIRKYFPLPSPPPPPNTSADMMDIDANPGGLQLLQESSDMRQKNEYSKRAAQILLRWGLQHGAVVIPKSTHPDRIRDNIDLFSFEIDADDMNALDAYSTPGERTRYCWDPTDVY
ncbi:hypothetical protein BGZ54_001124 [Gamsiella multidivaricata]|nr:hypothetical protein BGZ54_001124 [Gamsiella multidivaricata]